MLENSIVGGGVFENVRKKKDHILPKLPLCFLNAILRKLDATTVLFNALSKRLY